MDALEDFVTGLVKPMRDLLMSIFVYVVSVLVISIQSVTSLHSSSNWSDFTIVDPVLFIGIFVAIAFLSEVVLGFKQGLYKPFNALAKITGIISGVVIFWGFFVAVSSIIGVSSAELVIASLLICVSSIAGVFVRGAIAANK